MNSMGRIWGKRNNLANIVVVIIIIHSMLQIGLSLRLHDTNLCVATKHFNPSKREGLTILTVIKESKLTTTSVFILESKHSTTSVLCIKE